MPQTVKSMSQMDEEEQQSWQLGQCMEVRATSAAPICVLVIV